ncbi:hypothetical protein HYFRA_00009006 [Hymenoscyphus fraxineus]|uniref:Uncharacterized protein n=1 Tax=Hymenoscyphus fraxineus TaxID=746836 RepID=A0A9N9PSS0_9HELO|nr:hypothetical protein HYFRA_00009006 [Hymenoscyphus fraxineus]
MSTPPPIGRNGATVLYDILALRTRRPFPGCYLPSQTKEAMASFDTNSVDITLTVLRQLISFGLVPTNTFNPLETLLMEAAQSRLGHNQEDDWYIKYRIYSSIDQAVVPCTFMELQSRLPNIKHELTDILSNRAFQRTPAQPLLSLYTITPTAYSQFKNLKIDTKSPIQEQLFAKYFGAEYQFLSAHPPFFLQLECEVGDSPKKISWFRSFDFHGPDAIFDGTTINLTRRVAKYILCTVVKLSDGERVRVYGKDGHELPPGNLGDFRAIKGYNWSIEEKGVYILYYHRCLTVPGWPMEEELDMNAPEFVE